MLPNDYFEEVDGNRMYRELKSNQIMNFVGQNVGANLRKNILVENIKVAFDSKNENVLDNIKESEIIDDKTFNADLQANVADKTKIDTTNTESIDFKFKLNLNELDQTKNSMSENNQNNQNNIENLNSNNKLQIDLDQEKMIDSQNKYTDRDTNRLLKDQKEEEIANKKIAILKKDERFFKNVKEVELVIDEIVSYDHLNKV